MKKIILFLSLLLFSYTKGESQELSKVRFYENEKEMSDLSEQRQYIADALKMAREIQTKSPLSEKALSNHLPLTEEQGAKLLKYLQIASNSKNKLLVVFVDKKDGKLLGVKSNNYTSNVLRFIDKDEMYTMLRGDKIDFKIVYNDRTFLERVKTQKSSLAKSYNPLEPYEVIRHISKASTTLLMGLLCLNVDVAWYEKKPIDEGVELKDGDPILKDVSTYGGPESLGTYAQTVFIDTYSKQTKAITIDIAGYFKIQMNFAGLSVGEIYKCSSIATVHTKYPDADDNCILSAR